MKQIINSTKSNYGENNLDFANYSNNMGQLYFLLGKFDEAEMYLRKAIEIYEALLNTNHINYAISSNSLANLYEHLNRIPEACLLYRNSFKVYKYQIKMNTGFLSEKELAKFFSTFFYHLDIYHSFNKRHVQNYITLNDFSYDIELTRKGLLLKSAISVKNRILESRDTSLVNAYHEMRSLRKKIEKQKLIAPKDRSEDIITLETQANDLEKNLTLKSEDYRKVQLESDITWEAVKQNLKPGESAIEFSNFHYYKGNVLTDSIIYCASVLRCYDTIPQMIYLCEENQLKKAIPPSLGSAFKETNLAYNSSALYNLIWRPIDSLLTRIETVYFAPSGLLNSVSMGVITCPDNKTLMEKYNLVQLSSTRTLAIPEDPGFISNAVVYGGINYDVDTTAMLTKAKKYHENEDELLAYNRSATWNNRSGFRYLIGTQKESEQIL
jgi:tetratricopeptide (TPR) repeat protein